MSLDRSEYGEILNGRPADAGKEQVESAFAVAFSREKNLRAWRICGAVPCTRAPLLHRSVRREWGEFRDASVSIENGVSVELVESAKDVDWTTISLDKLQKLNEAACDALTGKGFKGSALRVKLRSKPTTLISRLPADATPEQRVEAIVQNGINLSSLFYTVGPGCLSTDEIFIAAEYKLLLAKWEKDKKERTELVKEKQKEDAAKAVLAQGKANSALLVKELKVLLKWKPGKDYSQKVKNTDSGRDKGRNELALLWNDSQGEATPDIVIPEELEKPSVPSINETELGRLNKAKLLSAIASAHSMDDASARDALVMLTDVCTAKGVDV
ncbi:MAG: hypothetical protein ACREOZ_03510 [Gloeomargaritales cyanobacterium]